MKYSNLDKILFTKSKITKEDILDYYAKISSYFLAHVQNHPIVLQRFPNGIDQESFFQKNVPDYYPKFIKTTTVTLKKGGKQKLVIINNIKTLLDWPQTCTSSTSTGKFAGIGQGHLSRCFCRDTRV